MSKNGKIVNRICSFVIRQRRLTYQQKFTLQKLWPNLGVNYTDQLLSFDRLFCNIAPIILEIGFGIGTSLIYTAQQNSTKNFLGIEVYTPGVIKCLLSAHNYNLNNLRIICHDAIEVLEKMIPNNSLNMVQLFFSDPWPKKRHHKRRLVQPYFAKLILHKLELGGVFHIATDWYPYANHILDVMCQISNYKNLSVSGNYIERPVTRPMTKFEIKGKKLGHKIFDLMFKKIK
ncbi:tRNA (guanine-N(7)-)-methyltransferase [Candidatus Arsenophonus lipoptenae]|uniref:tRNA (guanine-N(7)-)-methyltransferase n=1 Tax=Candidatus Arsenophonus lipoptenae TaxID=634113 RepID=A0A0X9VU33_9GAMM|nr:tRNA (guanosine(46)-N7)-methyltransferase TrmB [Candidatus Arsenophonus lipoptenae]AMA64743.1 tRNA (guanine-N(7)-)-methyltransferase [Candidatus Arsenophonus lipoptenae]